MKQFNVYNRESGYSEVFYTLKDAKKAMKEHNAKGSITKIYSNGDWIPCGEIKLSESNKTFIANTKQKVKNYN
jgi:hypothetical protein